MAQSSTASIGCTTKVILVANWMRHNAALLSHPRHKESCDVAAAAHPPALSLRKPPGSRMAPFPPVLRTFACAISSTSSIRMRTSRTCFPRAASLPRHPGAGDHFPVRGAPLRSAGIGCRARSHRLEVCTFVGTHRLRLHHTVLSEFRSRLLAGSAEQLLLDVLVARFHALGLLKTRGRQHTDSTRAPARTWHQDATFPKFITGSRTPPGVNPRSPGIAPLATARRRFANAWPGDPIRAMRRHSFCTFCLTVVAEFIGCREAYHEHYPALQTFGNRYDA